MNFARLGERPPLHCIVLYGAVTCEGFKNVQKAMDGQHPPFQVGRFSEEAILLIKLESKSIAEVRINFFVKIGSRIRIPDPRYFEDTDPQKHLDPMRFITRTGMSTE